MEMWHKAAYRRTYNYDDKVLGELTEIWKQFGAVIVFVKLATTELQSCMEVDKELLSYCYGVVSGF